MLIYGHRGASVNVRPNTVEACAFAVEQGADGVELDVRRSRDGALVISHDDRAALDATPFIELDLREIKTTTPWVPTLDEAWDALGPSALLNIEIKNFYGQADYDPTHRTGLAVVRWIADHDTGNRILVSSFNTQTLDAVK
ncbi:MAG: glycerophosphodiester phosphodiesterase, partial [Actinomycetota bacterium]|nr:glycerophosphodiester phosphodiesterase [Actinomycetota bacterium]